MITAEMSECEILREFWRDYREIITPRLFGWINGHKRIIREAQSKSKDGWAKLKEIREIKTPGLNKYRCVVKAKYDKKTGPGFIATTYTITRDKSGRNIVHVLPTAMQTKALITFDSHFFYRYSEIEGKSLGFTELVDDFMRPGINFHADISDTWENEDINFCVFLGGDRLGFGKCDYDNMLFYVKTYSTPSLLGEWANELGLGLSEEEDYLKVYKAWKERAKESKVVIPCVCEEKSEKQKEIDAAWEEYYSRG